MCVSLACAWCGRHLKGSRKTERKSHGICLPCVAREFGAKAMVDLAAKVGHEADPWEEWTDDGGEG